MKETKNDKLGNKFKQAIEKSGIHLLSLINDILDI